MRALAREQARAIRAMAGLPHKEEGDESIWTGIFGEEENQLDPYCVFDCNFRDKDAKGSDKGKHG